MLFCRYVSFSHPPDVSRSEADIPMAWCHSCSSSCRFNKSLLFLIFGLKLYNKVYLLEHFICLIIVCDVLYIIILIMTPRNDLSYD
jgi:hypothetical protein